LFFSLSLSLSLSTFFLRNVFLWQCSC
jgi:hypothetical protein